MPAIQDGISRRLQAERKRVGLTQEQLCASTGLSKVTLRSYETGATSPTVKFLSDISKQGLNVHHILFGSPESDDTSDLAQDFKLIQDCYDQVGFFLAANCHKCPDLHRWRMVQELYVMAKAKPEMSIQDLQIKLRDLYAQMAGRNC